MHLAVMNRISDSALALLDADPRCAHEPNMSMQSPLYIAVMNGLDHVINKIANQGLSVASISISIHGTALHQAVLADNSSKNIYAYIFNYPIYFLKNKHNLFTKFHWSKPA